MFLGIDLGTGSAKALLLVEDGRTVAEARHGYPLESPRPGWVEASPEMWWRAVGAVVRDAVRGRAADVSALGLSGQMHGVVLCNAAGRPLRPAILWADGRAEAELEPYRRLSPALRRKLANPLAAGMAGPSLLWLRDQEPEVYRQARWALQPKDWLRLKLTGEACAEPSDASATLLYDLPGNIWALDVAEALGLRTDWLAPLQASSEIASSLLPEAARQLGLRAGLPVAAGAADTAAALGSGLSRGQVQLGIGSGAQLISLQREARAHRGVHLYRDAAAGYYALAAIQNAELALEWVRQMLGYSWPEMERALAVTGSEGVTFLPYLTGAHPPPRPARPRRLVRPQPAPHPGPPRSSSL